MKNVEMRMRRRNYVIDFSNFQVNISINVKFHPSRRDENNHMNAREIINLSRLAGQLGYRDHMNGPFVHTFRFDGSEIRSDCWMAVDTIQCLSEVTCMLYDGEGNGTGQPKRVNNIYKVSRDTWLLFMLSDGNWACSIFIWFFRLSDPTVRKPL